MILKPYTVRLISYVYVRGEVGVNWVGSYCVCSLSYWSYTNLVTNGTTQYSGRVQLWSPAIRLNLVAGGTTQYSGPVRIRGQAVPLNTLVAYNTGKSSRSRCAYDRQRS